jgi:hypothetical protein
MIEETWEEYEQNINRSYAGGHHTDGKLDAYRHGINTAMNCIRSSLPPPRTCQAAAEMLKLLKAIAFHPHCTEGGGTEYGLGVQDGHRCAATAARELLAKMGECKP